MWCFHFPIFVTPFPTFTIDFQIKIADRFDCAALVGTKYFKLKLHQQNPSKKNNMNSFQKNSEACRL